jgi:hypothetical protein
MIMTKHLSAYLLDPAQATLSLVKIPRNDSLQAYYDLIVCKTIDAIRFDDGAVIAYVDDEANFNPITGLWCLKSARDSLFAGRAVFVSDADGDSVTPRFSMQSLAVKLTSFRRLPLKACFTELQFSFAELSIFAINAAMKERDTA